ncbi:hypothetical protein [Virgibacillus halodenitrificans]|uniref:hypothetical protein n=1 Tax=Virgibacillus halodenitrificans TaxID=1482 RepID=UPI000EF4DC1E|nr:hypothetical protein [Virgibacillus halodenitrificans]
MDLLKGINKCVQKGFEITYDIVNQFENGYGDQVLAGNMLNFTYTFYIFKKEEILWSHSVDSLEDGFLLALDWLKKNRYTKMVSWTYR